MEQGKTFEERRRYARLKTSVEVEYTIIGKPGTIEVFSKNISAGGLCVIAKEELVKDTPLELVIKLPDLKDPIRALARVIWQRAVQSAQEEDKGRFDTGMEFTGISDFDRFNINRYVTGHIELQG